MSRQIHVANETMVRVDRLKALLAPVTAIATLGHLVLFADGPSLHVLSLKTYRIVASEQVFRAQTIHGITSTQHGDSSTRILIWGGRFVRVFIIGSSSSVILAASFSILALQIWH